MELPRALWPWRQSLSIFPKDLAIALGGVIDKLALLIGPLISPDSAGRNEPDGFEGIGRRGSFERLLTSEWALADEAPLEFLRRVSTGELSFLEIAHQKPTVARRCVALFDVGPDQRGAPRIVHLAALILLAQRAHDGGAKFSWGILQDSTNELIADVNEESVRRLLEPGSNQRMSLDDVIRFYQALQDDEAEVFFVGGLSTSEVVANLDANRVEIEDSYDPEKPFDLHVTVVGTKGKPRSVKLELPRPNMSVRLLRDPFQVARAAPQKSKIRIAQDTNIVFTRDLRKVFLRGAEGELITIPVPNSPNSNENPKPRIFRPPPGEMLAAVGRLTGTRTIAAATVNAEGVVVHELSPRVSSSVRQKQYSWDARSEPVLIPYSPPWVADPDKPTKLGTLFHFGAKDPLIIYDGGQILFQFTDTTFHVWQFPVTCVIQQGGNLGWMQAGEKPSFIHHSAEPSNSSRLPSGTQEVRSALGGFLAARISASTWEVFDAKGHTVHTRGIPPQDEVLGIAQMKEFLFYILDATRTRIFCLDGNQRELCFTAPAPIRSIQATPACWLIAFITEDDELCIYSRDHKKLLLQIRLGAS